MRKNLGYISLVYFVLRASFIGLTTLCLVTTTKQDSWISIILSFIIGLLPIYLLKKLCETNDNLSLPEKLDILFPKTKILFKITLFFLFFFLSLLNFFNLTNLIHKQFLNNTPTLVISIFFIIPIYYLITKNNKVISRVSLILFFISIILIFITYTGLLNKIEIENLKPFLEYNPNKSIIYFISYNILSCFMLLIFPNKYIKESIVPGYIIGAISIFIYMFLLISVLGIDLVLLFEYPSFHLLKLVYDNFISFRLENFLVIQWILDIFMYTTIGLKFTNEILCIKKKYIIPIMIIILNTFLSKSNSTIMTKIITNVIPYIILLLLSYIPSIIYIKQKKDTKSLKN